MAMARERFSTLRVCISLLRMAAFIGTRIAWAIRMVFIVVIAIPMTMTKSYEGLPTNAKPSRTPAVQMLKAHPCWYVKW